MTGFWTPQCVEEAFRAHASYSSRIGIERALDAALAAKDREAMIEQAVSALEESERSHATYEGLARAVLAALGLLASPDEEH